MPDQAQENQVPTEIPAKWKTIGEFRELTKDLPDETIMKFGCMSCGYDHAKDLRTAGEDLIIEGEMPENLAEKYEPIYRPTFTKGEAVSLAMASDTYSKIIDDLMNKRPVNIPGDLLNPDGAMLLQKKTVEILKRLGILDDSKIIKPNKKIILPGG